MNDGYRGTQRRQPCRVSHAKGDEPLPQTAQSPPPPVRAQSRPEEASAFCAGYRRRGAVSQPLPAAEEGQFLENSDGS